MNDWVLMNIKLVVLFSNVVSFATKTHQYPVVPQVGDYVILPGFGGDIGVPVYSRIIGDEITLQFRDVMYVDGLEQHGWELVGRKKVSVDELMKMHATRGTW